MTTPVRLSLRGVANSAGLYPLSLTWVAAAGIMMLLVAHKITVVNGILLFTAVTILALLWGTYRELKAVHKLVDGQRAELLDRIDQLTDLLIHSGVTVPDASASEKTARQNVSNTARGDANTQRRQDTEGDVNG